MSEDNDKKVKSFSALDKGLKKQNNEDNLLIFEPSEINLKNKGSLYIVVDGVGGQVGGEIASKMATEIIKESYYSDKEKDIRKSLINAVKKANKEIFKKGLEDEKLGTTVVCSVVKDDYAYFVNVGDSRGYIFRRGKLQQITQDHSFVAERVKLGQLTEEEARVHPRRNVILRCLGNNPKVEIDTFTEKIFESDKILLCSDGLWGEMPKKELEHILASVSDSNKALKSLVEKALDYGGSDNIGAILIDVIEGAALEKEPEGVPVIDIYRTRKFKALVAVFAATTAIFVGLATFLALTFSDFIKPPVVSISANSSEGNVPFRVEFTGDFKDLTSKDAGRISDYIWKIEDNGKIITEGNYGKDFVFTFNDPGKYEVTLSCRDNYSNKGKTIKTVNALDNQNPFIKIEAIGLKQDYWIGDNEKIAFNITASDATGVSKIDLYINGIDSPLKSFEKPEASINYTLSLDEQFKIADIPKSEILEIYAVAHDDSGNSATTDPIKITINSDAEPPVITGAFMNSFGNEILLKDNQSFELPITFNAPYYLPIRFEVKDNTAIDRVELKIIDKTGHIVQKETEIVMQPFLFIWELTQKGDYLLNVTAYDKYNNPSESLNYNVSISPFQKGYFVFEEILDGSGEIFVGNYKYTGTKNLTDNPANDVSPILSDKQDKIYFGSNMDGDYDIWEMNINGGAIRRAVILNESKIVYPLAIIDGRTIIYRIEGESGNDYHEKSIAGY